MKAASEQTEALLLELERRVGALQESSEKLEAQLKVMLVLESRGNFSSDLVARIARILASCLRTRGDWAQAGQYAQMAANLEPGRGRAGQQVRGGAGPLDPNETDSESSPRRQRLARAGSEPGLVGPSPRRRHNFVSWWQTWTGLDRGTTGRLGR